jgi:hypothetical protein
MGSVRSLKGAEGYLFQTYAAEGMVGSLLGYPVYENPYVPAIGTNAKSVLFWRHRCIHHPRCWRYRNCSLGRGLLPVRPDRMARIHSR